MGMIKNFHHIVSKFRHFRYKNVGPDTYDKNQPLLLTYLCPNATKASGGTKVIYRHVSLINSMGDSNISAQIFHAAQPSFRCEWRYPQLKFKRDFSFNGKNELFLLHEMWAAREAPMLSRKNISYGIFVQGAYLINRKSNYQQVKYAYEQARIILCVSDDIKQCLLFLFPHLAEKIIQVNISVNTEIFKPTTNKQNLITYMPRRLKKHADLVLFYLKSKLPSHWHVEAIQGMSESEVANKLSQSKIFMSFSELEGLGLPPIEAALSGNVVVGYTGEGGKEYWSTPLFQEVDCGNIMQYVAKVLESVHSLDNEILTTAVLNEAMLALGNRYHPNRETESLKQMTNLLPKLV